MDKIMEVRSSRGRKKSKVGRKPSTKEKILGLSVGVLLLGLVFWVVSVANEISMIEKRVNVRDAYAVFNGGTSGAVFMTISNPTEQDDRLTDARVDGVAMVELHTSSEDGNGVVRMSHLENGVDIPAHQERAFVRGGDHVMLMGVQEGFGLQGYFPMVLVFEKAGEVTVDVSLSGKRN